MTLSPTLEFEFTDDDFALVCRLIKDKTGISLHSGKRSMVYGRLARRLRDLQLDAFSTYLEYLAGNPEELVEFVNALTTNLTRFFREEHHFDYLKNELFPLLLTSNLKSKRIRIWSAGCSTGEEPHSIAIILAEALREHPGWDARILATDIDTSVLEEAVAGIYTEEEASKIPIHLQKKFLQRGTGSQGGFIRVSSEVRSLITFKQLNLMEVWPMKESFDIIFCRNVVIYFDKDTQKRLFDRYANALKPKGYLFVGHSEVLSKVTNRFELIGKTIYQKSE